jgi:lipoate-protein ligase A
MKFLDLTLPSPAENLALDEALLDWCETGGGGETLVFWEPRQTFVVVGYANKIASEVNTAACERLGLPIFRRCSGGGTVVQMPGGFNYSLLLKVTEDGPTRNITSANQSIMERNRRALAAATDRPVVVRGHTDLAIGDRKFAGNSQRRRRNYLLFHGTILLAGDLNLISELLLMPSLEPDYRDNRAHLDFVMNLNVPADRVKSALREVWNAQEPLTNPPMEQISILAREKYSTAEWNQRF